MTESDPITWTTLSELFTRCLKRMQEDHSDPDDRTDAPHDDHRE